MVTGLALEHRATEREHFGTRDVRQETAPEGSRPTNRAVGSLRGSGGYCPAWRPRAGRARAKRRLRARKSRNSTSTILAKRFSGVSRESARAVTSAWVGNDVTCRWATQKRIRRWHADAASCTGDLAGEILADFERVADGTNLALILQAPVHCGAPHPPRRESLVTPKSGGGIQLLFQCRAIRAPGGQEPEARRCTTIEQQARASCGDVVEHTAIMIVVAHLH